MKFAIVDDVREDSQKLNNYLGTYFDDKSIKYETEVFKCGEELLEHFECGKYFVVFLDIYMSGITGMDTAEKIRETDKNCIIIFTTKSSEYAVKSYRVRAFDYIQKPYDYSFFCEVMDNCINEKAQSIKYIELKEGRTLQKIMLKEIIYTDYSNHYIYIHTPTRTVKSYMSFAEFSPMLLAYPKFVCCYRNCIINMDEVATIKGKDFEMTNGEYVPIKKEWFKEIKQRYADYVFEKMEKTGIY